VDPSIYAVVGASSGAIVGATLTALLTGRAARRDRLERHAREVDEALQLQDKRLDRLEFINDLTPHRRKDDFRET
jgi:hypothetical protein